MSQQDNVKAAQQFGEMVNSRNFDGFHKVVAPSCIDRDPAPGQEPGPEGYKAFFGTMKEAFPDFQVSVDHMVADDDNVAFAYTLTGTHDGAFKGKPATGKKVKIRGMQISRFENGKMVERWGSSDELGLMKQIGAA